jgi:hypothetical protein
MTSLYTPAIRHIHVNNKRYTMRRMVLQYRVTRIGCTLFRCDMYMCRLRHINDLILSSLKMEGIRLLFPLFFLLEITDNM